MARDFGTVVAADARKARVFQFNTFRPLNLS
jgi:hypothetical protein